MSERFFVGGDFRGLVGGDLEGEEADVVGVVGEKGGDVEAEEGDADMNCGGPDGIVNAEVALAGVVVMSVGTAVVVELLFNFFGVELFLRTGMEEEAVLRLRISGLLIPRAVLGLPASPFPIPTFSPPRMPEAVTGRPEVVGDGIKPEGGTV